MEIVTVILKIQIKIHNHQLLRKLDIVNLKKVKIKNKVRKQNKMKIICKDQMIIKADIKINKKIKSFNTNNKILKNIIAKMVQKLVYKIINHNQKVRRRKSHLHIYHLYLII